MSTSLLLVSSVAAADSGGPDIDIPDDPPPAAAPSTGTVTIGGYGEMHFNRVMPEEGDSSSEIDFHRMVVYLGRQFDDKLSMYSELEVEHAIAADGQPGEVALEQAFIQYKLADETSSLGVFGVRAGIVLVPMGIINQWHEPPTFHGVERPRVDNLIIPTTWREGGAGIYGKPSQQLSYELYIVGGLNPLGFSASSGIRGGRQKVGEARADGLALTGRVELAPNATTVVGGSAYYGMAGPNASEVVDGDVAVLGVSADARTKLNGFEARAAFALFTISDTDELNALVDMDGNQLVDVADRLLGVYGEVAYDVLRSQPTPQQLLPFGRVEFYDTDPDDDTRSIVDIVLGLSYRPIAQVVFKGDVTLRRPGGDVDGDNATILDLGVGFLY